MKAEDAKIGQKIRADFGEPYGDATGEIFDIDGPFLGVKWDQGYLGRTATLASFVEPA